MKIKDLYELNTLHTKAGLLLNNGVNNEFYDLFSWKDLGWLIENKERIEEDFNNNIDKLKFDIIVNTNLSERVDLIINLAYESIDEFCKYMGYVKYEHANKKERAKIEKSFEKFKSKSEFNRLVYFDMNKL